ncbi:MAG: metallophosphoesterase family protein, partial [Candidatus Hodarchaeota archaeon]
KVNNGIVMNPGSVGQPRDGDPKASYVILTITGDHVDLSFERVPYDVEAASKSIINAGLPEINAKRLFFGK